jgi:hypothetical protein
VGAAAAPVDDREHLAGREPPEQQQRDGDPDAHPQQHVGGGIHPQRNPGHADHRHQPSHHPLAGVAPAPLGHQRVQDPNQQDREEGDRQRRQRPAAPAGPQVHPERPWPPGDRRQAHLDDEHEVPGDPPHDQVPPAPQHQQYQQQPGGQREQHPPRTDMRQAPQQRHQPGRLQAGQPPHDRAVDDRDRYGGAAQPAGEHRQRQPDQHHRGHQPADPAGLQPIRQRRGRPGGPPPTRRPNSLSEGGVGRQGRGWCRLVRGRFHGPPTGQLKPGMTTLFAEFWLVKADNTLGAAACRRTQSGAANPLASGEQRWAGAMGSVRPPSWRRRSLAWGRPSSM